MMITFSKKSVFVWMAIPRSGGKNSAFVKISQDSLGRDAFKNVQAHHTETGTQRRITNRMYTGEASTFYAKIKG